MSAEQLKAIAIKAVLDAIDTDDSEAAEEAMKLVRAILAAK